MANEFTTAKAAERLDGGKMVQPSIAPLALGQAAGHRINSRREQVVDTSEANLAIVERLDKTNELLEALIEIIGSKF